MGNTDKERQFEAMVHLHRDMLWSLCRSFTFSEAWQTEDAFQEVLCALWDATDAFEGRSDEKTYVYRVAYNALLRIKRHSANQKREHTEGGGNASLAQPSADEAQYRELLDLIDKTLSNKDRMAFQAWIDGFSLKEIATMTGSTESAVAMRLSRAKRKVRQAYLHNYNKL